MGSAHPCILFYARIMITLLWCGKEETEPGDNKRVAVKIVDARGIESLKILEVERWAR